jgi:superfamily II DNA or RNA helicase
MATIPNKEAYFICGEMPVEERQDIIHKMEEQNDIIVVAMASIFSTGINIKNLHYILFIAGGKSFIRIVQGIGRGLRLHENKNFLTIIDVYDNLEYSEQHAEERKLIYDDEQIEWKEIEVIL